MENNEFKIEFENEAETEASPSVEQQPTHHHHSHGHSSHHNSSHRRSHRRKKTKAEKIKHFFKKYKYRVSNIAIASLFVIILIVLGVSLDKEEYSGKDPEVQNTVSGEEPVASDSSIQLEIPLFGEKVVLVNYAVEKYLDADEAALASRFFDDYQSLGRLDTGNPVRLWYNVNGIPAGCKVRNAELLISENENFTSPSVYSLGDKTEFSVYNLKTGTQYYYRFVLTLSNGIRPSVEGSFETAETPRMLNVEGVYNMRDFGGWRTLGGKRIRQGLLYRSTELDGAVKSKYTVTPDGVSTLLTVLGIRTDMDLRAQSENAGGRDALGAGVKHNYYNTQMYSDSFSDAGKESLRKIFADLAKRDNYPVLMHCTHGLDRTGTVCYLLGAVLGVSEGDLMKEYQLSAMHHGELWNLGRMNEFIGRLKALEGRDIQQKAENFLLSAGVTSSEIRAIKEIFIEE